MNYLYNGVELPALPEWDKEKYPYAAICASGHTSYYLRLLPPDATYQIYNNKWVLMGNNTLTSNHSDPTGWGNFFESGSAYISVRNRNSIGIGTVWTDFNLLNQNGTVFMAASEPVPVEASTFTPDPISMTMGWLVGRRIAGQRK